MLETYVYDSTRKGTFVRGTPGNMRIQLSTSKIQLLIYVWYNLLSIIRTDQLSKPITFTFYSLG